MIMICIETAHGWRFLGTLQLSAGEPVFAARAGSARPGRCRPRVAASYGNDGASESKRSEARADGAPRGIWLQDRIRRVFLALRQQFPPGLLRSGCRHPVV